ncbi:MAG: TonB-dependent receptor [Clostridiales bacterium]|nr:TonB-dependent receptor [Clostridiales bacterium]
MDIKRLIAWGLMAWPLIVCAKGDITGRVVNGTSHDPMDYVSVHIVNESNGTPLQITATTDEKGHFILSSVPDGNYIVKILNIGSVDLDIPVKVNGGNIDLATLVLEDDSAMRLKEVVVEGIRSQMRFELDKKVFTVDANIASAGQSASELLESIPSVEVDQDGEVSLRGNSSVTIWINGKESGLTADNRAQILEQIPGESIDRIEVITNPSAKYSPEGTAGIINIILKKDRRAGYFGSAELSGNSRGGGNASFNINYNSSRWDSYAGIGFRMRRNTGGSEMRRDFTNDTYTNSDGESNNRGNNLFARLGTTFHATDNDEIYLNGFGGFGHHRSRNETRYESTVADMWSHNTELSRSRGDHHMVHAETGYKHTWSDNHNIEFLVGFNNWGGPSWNSYHEDQTYPDGSDDMEYREQRMPIKTANWEAKIDYTNQLTSWLKIETGFNGNYNHENTPNTTWRGTSPADITLAENLYNRFIYNNNISALYLTLGGKVNEFSFSAGLRSESWQVRSQSLRYGDTRSEAPRFKNNKFALFPSLFLSYTLPHDNEVQINYTRRIRRPWGGMMNSFLDISDPTNYSYGNEELEPQYSNAFELNYLKSFTWHMISLSAYIRTSDNMMNRISYRNPYDGIIYSTWANVANQVNSGMEIVGKNSFLNRAIDLTTTVNLYNNHVSAWSMTATAYNPDPTLYPDSRQFNLSGNKQNSFAWDARMMANVKLPLGISFQATGRYASESKTAQGSRQGGWSVDAGLRKVAGNWSFSLNGRDLFDSRKFKSTTITDEYRQSNKRWRGGRIVGLTIKYSFGNMSRPEHDGPDGDAGGSDSGGMDSYNGGDM